jgi:hypothetical protein
LDNWREVFEQAFDRKTGQKFRTLVSTAFEGRNATSHLAIPLTDAEALLSTAQEVMRPRASERQNHHSALQGFD